MRIRVGFLVASALVATGCGNDLTLDAIGVAAPPSANGPVAQPPIALMVPNAIAMKGNQLSNDSFMWSSDVGTPWNNPDALVLLMSNDPLDCRTPVVSTDVAPPSRWQTVLVIPPAIDTTGPIDLRDCRIGSYEMAVTCDPTYGACGREISSGNCFSGVLDVTSSDAMYVAFTLSGPSGSPHPPASGTYTALRCGPVPPAPVPSPAIAIRGSKLPAGSMTTPPDPNALYVVVGTGSCSNPLGNIDCSGGERLVFALPPSLQTTGMVELDDPRLVATYSIAGDPGTPDCSAVGGDFTSGLVDVRSVDPTVVTFRVFGSYSFSGMRSFELDGLYAATICP
jgi:hypothetical protein